MTEQQGAGDKHRKSPVKRGGEGRSSSAWSSTLGTDLPGISLWVTYRESGCLVWVLTFSPGFSLHPVAVLVHGPRQDEAVISRCVRLGEGQARDAVVGGAAVTPRSPGSTGTTRPVTPPEGALAPCHTCPQPAPASSLCGLGKASQLGTVGPRR